ncbi:NUDIX hydrolase [uncultured Fusobacterium sp.]|uniref:NUDIX hydrolase n=1 Tax=uncultured Fusobacterium sp. TaxID=159267 RepID=UPI0025F41C76|nr:NUDIX hydrolase [uncultured Fusobacterium sp.]
MEKYKHLEKKEVFKNNHIAVYSEKLQLPNNKVVEWTFTSKREAVGVIAVFDDDTTLLVKQYRPAVQLVTTEIPAGILEKGEDPKDAALRELEEETGYRAEKIEKICEFYSSPGITAGKFYLFYAENLKKTHQHLDEDEFLEVERVPLKDINITSLFDAKSMLAVDYAKKKRNL